MFWTQVPANTSFKVQVTHSDDLTSISGFNSNTQPTWTQGNGYLPLTACDTVTGQPRSFDLWDSDKLSTVTFDIPSLGKPVRADWSFYFESVDSLVAVTPDKQSRFEVELGDDAIHHLPHDMRSGRQSAPLPEILQKKAHVLSAKRVPEALNALLLHGIFLHCGMETVYNTMLHTCGYVAQQLPDPF